jgi:deoxyribose-phosphate aldolase
VKKIMNNPCCNIASLIDHALLAPNLTSAQLEAGCREAAAFRVAGFCAMPSWVSDSVKILEGTGVPAFSVAGFPHGTSSPEVKAEETRHALGDGAVEIDMVCNISRAVSNDWDFVERDIAMVLGVVRRHNAKLKVIFETCYLTDAQIIALCGVCARVGVDWVKTSTGFASAGATEHAVRLMREHTPGHIGVKAAGGIRDLAAVRLFQSLGCSRIGTSRTAAIMAELAGGNTDGQKTNGNAY